MESKKIVLGGTDEAPTATITKATIGDIFTTALNTNEAITGMYKYVQIGGAGLIGAMIQSKRMGGSLNVFTSPS